jgi:hypothetical protein
MAVNGYERLFVPADARWMATVNTPALTHRLRHPAWLFDAVSTELASFGYSLPTYWRSYHVDLYWTNAGAGTGDVVWTLQTNGLADGETLGNPAGGTPTVTVAAPAQDVLKVSRMTSSALSYGANDYAMTGVLWRDGGNAADTLGNDAAALGVEFVRAS